MDEMLINAFSKSLPKDYDMIDLAIIITALAIAVKIIEKRHDIKIN